jgi:sulfide:quinone oxidoreductase
VTVVGGGFAAAELVLALRSRAEDRVHVEWIAPAAELPLRIASTGAAYEERDVPVYDLRRIAADAGAAFRQDVVEAVAASAHRVRLASGTTAHYDVLVVAVGARATAGVAGASTFRDQRDAGLIELLVQQMRDGTARRVVFAAPGGVAWTLPLYELALLAANERLGTELTLVTPEQRALEVFGTRVSAEVERVLERRGLVLRCGAVPGTVTRDGLRLTHGDTIKADRVIAVPRLIGRSLAGVPADWNGFVATDRGGEVLERPGVFAVGDITRFPVKQGGVATQQADLVAARIARLAGAPVSDPSDTLVLGSQLLGAGEPLYLRAEYTGDGRLRDASASVSGEPPWWPAGKLFGRHLAPWMARQGLAAAGAR